MRRIYKNKIFHDKRCQRLCVSRNWKKSREKKNYSKSTSKTTLLRAPTDLSIFNNTTPSIDFFNQVITTIKHCEIKSDLYFDLSAVESITPDAVMYLIAIIKNTKRIRALEISCRGNMPRNENARKVFQEAGFFNFVYAHNRQHIQSKTDSMRIENGKDADGVTASAFCDFVHACCHKSCSDTKRLYPMIVELMTNTQQHAYQNNGIVEYAEMNANWYIFAQDIGSVVQFVFLDTGVGIPSTVARKIHEKVIDLFSDANDAVYLKSVLVGDYKRTETGLEHRGKGIPGIYEDCQNKRICNLSIISGKAKCSVLHDATICSESIDHEFKGTLFSWEIEK